MQKCSGFIVSRHQIQQQDTENRAYLASSGGNVRPHRSVAQPAVLLPEGLSMLDQEQDCHSHFI